MSAALAYPGNVVVEFDSALLGYIEGGGMIIRGTKGDMRLHRSAGEPQDWQERSHAPANTETRQGPVAGGAARQDHGASSRLIPDRTD